MIVNCFYSLRLLRRKKQLEVAGNFWTFASSVSLSLGYVCQLLRLAQDLQLCHNFLWVLGKNGLST